MRKKVVSDEEDAVEFGDVAARYNDGDEDDEDDEDGPDEFEKDDFIVDDVEEEEERADSDEERHKKKKKRKKRESADVLDEDDWELLRDNNAVHHLSRDSKKFKRLKKAQRDSDEERLGLSDDEFGGGKGGRTAKEKLKRSLFGDDDGVPLEDVAEEEQQVEEEEDGDIGEDDDEMADFIVDEEEVDETGAGLRWKKVKKKKFKKSPGVSSSALQEAHDLFGDVDELLQRRKQDLESAEWKERRLEDEFEPIVLSEKYMTQKDDQIRMFDIPERMKISEESTGSPPMDDTSISEESDWIYNQLLSGVLPLFKCAGTESSKEGKDLPIDKKHIARFLELNHVQKLDIPFIAMYRKEECLSLLKDPEQLEDEQYQDKSEGTSSVKLHKVLWAIHDLDRKWLLLQKRKNALFLCYNSRFEEESRRIYDETRLNLNQQLIESILESLRAAESEREVDDIDAKFNMHFPPGEACVDEGQYKRPKRRSHYSECSKAGLWEMASKFGVSPEQLGQQLSLKKMVDILEDAKETPEDMASNFTCSQFETPQAVLKGARHMATVQISCEPSIRKHIRSIYLNHAVVSTSPTPDGSAVIDPFHQFAGVKWLREKPISKFVDSQWLLIQKAEEEKLLQLTFKLPDKEMKKLVTDLEEQYLSDGVSKSAQLWNEQRNLILHDAIHTFLLPSMEKEARQLLTTRAKNWLVWKYGRVLWDKIFVGPFQMKGRDATSDDEAAPRVMACCWGPGKPATTFVMLDSFGQVLDVLYAGSLTLRSQNINDQQRKRNDQQRVLRFMTDHQPNVVVLGAVNLSCTKLKEDIYEIIYKMIEENPRDVGHEMDELSIVYGDESLPHLYENSRISSDQLTGQSGIVKRAVALGRYLQNPLAMVATLCGPGRDILSWKISPLENFLTPDEKFAMIEHVMVDVTNQVGLDINLALGHEWLFAPLQFISGLGPRKAASLQRSLVRAGPVFSRKDFVTAHGLGKKVFFNSVGFLRVRRSGLAANNSQFIDLLDDTRIHPESYGLAQEMAKDVYEMDNGDVNNDDDDDAREMAIEHVRDQPSFLKALKLDEYVADKKRENKKETLKDIKRELIHGFQDSRKQYKEPNQDEEFYMISGETEETLIEGKTVQATVRRVQGPKAICALESGLTGILTKEDYADDWRDIVELSDRLREGDILTCKIKSIMKNRYQVYLVSRENEMRSNRYQQVQDLDPYYHEDRISLQNEQDKARKEKELAKKHFKPRMIIHPRFQNITADEAIEFLSNKEAGESIIRPSLRGPSYLTLTLKVYEGVYAHKDIVEGGKELKDITSLLRIGKTLKIGEDTFEDLDEVVDRYVDPLVMHLKAMLSYRKLKRGTKAEVDELLRTEKLENEMRIVYSFGISHEHPGTFILTYIRTTNPRHEYVGLSPNGFKFRRRMFEDIDHLVAYFQNHINDPLHEPAPSIRSVAAIVPKKGLDEGDGWGGSNEGGWGGQSSDQDGRNDRSQDPLYGGHGRGRGGGSFNNRKDTGNKDDNDTFTGGWSSGGDGGGSGGWSSRGGGGGRRSSGGGGGSGGWSSGGAGGGGWSSGGGGENDGEGRGNDCSQDRPHRGRGRGRGRGSYNRSDLDNKSGDDSFTGGWSGGAGSGNHGGWSSGGGGDNDGGSGSGGWGGGGGAGGWSNGGGDWSSGDGGAGSWSGGGGSRGNGHGQDRPQNGRGRGRGRGQGRGSYNNQRDSDDRDGNDTFTGGWSGGAGGGGSGDWSSGGGGGEGGGSRGNGHSQDRPQRGHGRGRGSYNNQRDSDNRDGNDSFTGGWSGVAGSGGSGGWSSGGGNDNGGGTSVGGWSSRGGGWSSGVGASNGSGSGGWSSGGGNEGGGWGNGGRKAGGDSGTSGGGSGWSGDGSGGWGNKNTDGADDRNSGWGSVSKKDEGGSAGSGSGWGNKNMDGADDKNSGWGSASKKDEGGWAGSGRGSGSGSGW